MLWAGAKRRSLVCVGSVRIDVLMHVLSSNPWMSCTRTCPVASCITPPPFWVDVNVHNIELRFHNVCEK